MKSKDRNKKGNEEKELTRSAQWGRLGETITKDYIARKGFPVTAENWRCGGRYEIDLISQQGDVMAFIEVKTRNGKYNSAEDAIDIKKMKQLVKAANLFLQQQERDFTARFDVALIEGSPENYEFTYLEDAFIPPLG